MAKKFTGKVERLDDYLGFIRPDDGSDLISFDELAVKSYLSVGEPVEYDIEPRSGNTMELAINVTVLPAAPLGRNVAQDHRGGGGGVRGHGRKIYKDFCQICWNAGHKEIHCPRRASGSSSTAPTFFKGYCDICQSHGHFTEQCRRGGASSSFSPRSDVCSKCREPGHYAKNCPKGTCYICGVRGHYAKECPKGPNRGCFFCGKHGHMRGACRSLKEDGQKKCYRCSKLGHFTHECTKVKDDRRSIGGRTAGGGVGEGGACLVCGKKGHSARLCRY